MGDQVPPDGEIALSMIEGDLIPQLDSLVRVQRRTYLRLRTIEGLVSFLTMIGIINFIMSMLMLMEMR